MTSLLRTAVLAVAVIGAASAAVIGQPADCAPSGGLNFICGLTNPEDLVLVPNTRLLLASGMEAGSGLNLIDTQARRTRSLYRDNSARPDRARFPDCPSPLDPKVANLHGLSLRTAANGRYTLYATNHGGRESIEVFEIAPGTGGAAALQATWIGCVLMPQGLAANSVAAFSDGTLVATVLTLPGRSFDDLFAGRNTGAVFEWRPGASGFRQLPGTELPGNNGIDTSPDDREFFVVSSGLKRIVAFARADTSKPLRTAQLREFAPDNVRWMNGRLLTAGMLDEEPACGGAPRKPEDIRCARGYVVASIDPATMSVTELARGPRTTSFTGTAMAIPVGDELWISSFNANRVAYRPLRR